MEFLVKWVGFDEIHNSWEPWNIDTRRNMKVHEYLISHGLNGLVPREFRYQYPEHFLENVPKRRRL